MEKDMILVIDFYSQFNQLITRRIRECNVYSEIVPHNTSIEEIKKKNPKGIIFTGGPSSVNAEDGLMCDKEIFNLGIPILGICYGMQMTAKSLGGEVGNSRNREYGTETVEIDNSSKLFEGFDSKNVFLMSHFVIVQKLPEGFAKILI